MSDNNNVNTSKDECDNDINVDVLPKKNSLLLYLRSWYSKQTSFEKYFYWTLAVCLVLYIILNLLAYNTQVQKLSKGTVLEDVFEKILETDAIKENISKFELEINKSLNAEIDDMNQRIDQEVDSAFNGVQGNVDTFLDFHYSVIGEYTELGVGAAEAVGYGVSLEDHIKDKIFGDGFNNQLSNLHNSLEGHYLDSANNHFKAIESYAFEGVDSEIIDYKALDQLKSDFTSRNLADSVAKFGGLAARGTIQKASAAIVTKTVSRIASKIPAKAVAKFGAKRIIGVGLSSVLGLGAAAVCGPCGIVVAIAVWFLFDYLFVAGDEYLNRDEMKAEIMTGINESKEALKNELRKVYFERYKALSESISEDFEKRRLIDRI